MDEDMSPRSDCLGLNVLPVPWLVSVDDMRLLVTPPLMGLPSYSTGLILGARGCFSFFCFLFCIPRQQDAENSRLRGKSILSLLPKYLSRAGCGFWGQRLWFK